MPDRKRRSFFSEEIIVITIGIAVVYWIIDSIFWVFAGVELGFSSHLFRPDIGEMGARIIVVCLFAIFGSHAHQMIKKQRIARKDMEALKAANEKLSQEINSLKKNE